jgi:RNA polymerase sigma factor (sigma-70 family)
MQMRDSEVVASVVAGDPEGLATAYDRYADPLYKYCRALLRDPADAADAVQDAFVIAAARLSGLGDQDRLRAWLFAVARNESRRIPRAEKGTSALDEAPDVSDDGADVSEGGERVDLRALLEGASEGLNPGEREVIELQLRQGMEQAEVASVLGVSRNHAHTLLSRARGQLEVCLAVLLVGRAGRAECGELGSMLTGWDGRLTVLLRKRVHRHIERCAACSARRSIELRPAMLLDLSPSAALAAGAAASFRLAAGAPAGLKAHTVALATGQEAGAMVHRAAVLSRAGAFGRHGFPKPVHGAGKAGLAAHRPAAGGGVRRALRSSPTGQATVAAAVVLAVIIAAAAFALTASSQGFAPTADRKPSASASAPAPAATSPARLSKPTPARPAPTVPAAVAVTAAPATTAAPSPTTAAPTPAAVSPSPSTPGSSVTTPGTSPTPSPRSSPPPTGTLVVAPRGGPMLVRSGGTQIFLLATGGAVDWSATVSNDPGDAIGLSLSSGTLTATATTATLTVTASQFVPCLSSSYPTITINPGGTQFWVCTGWIKPLGGHGGHGGHRHRRRHPRADPAAPATPIGTAPGDVRPARQRAGH